nr:MAG TPA: hypothetical protein [Inoviridae sp.]
MKGVDLTGGATAYTLASFLSDVGSFFTSMLGWVGQVITFITGEPLLLVFVIIAVASIVISMARSWIPGSGV